MSFDDKTDVGRVRASFADAWSDDEPTVVEAVIPFSALRWEEPAHTYQPPVAGVHDNNLPTLSEMPAVEG